MQKHSRPVQAEVQQIITRAEAKAFGFKRYFTGQACKNGHVAARYTQNKRCCACTDKNRIKWATENKERVNEYKRKYYALDKEKHCEKSRDFRKKNPDYVKQCNQKWARNNPKRRKEINVSWAERNRQYLADRQRKWRIQNPEKAKEAARNARAKRRAAIGSHTQEEIAKLIRSQNKKCAYCKISLATGYHADHVIALSRGGSNYISNIQILCPKCNTRKGAKHPIDYAREIGLLL